MLTGLMVSLATGVGAVVLAERADTSFHTLGDLRGFTRVPVVASIPRVTTASDIARQRRRRWLKAAAIAVGLALIVVSIHLFAHGNGQLVRVLPGQ
jgi:hypothetical protein